MASARTSPPANQSADSKISALLRESPGLEWTAVRPDVQEFCDRYGMRVPIVQAPMAGACPPALAAAVAEAGGMGAAGVLLDHPEQIARWTADFRAASGGALQLNIWIPDAP